MEKGRVITIKIKQKVLSFLEGVHRTLKFGEEDDLKNIREYTYGDNVKRINWIITAKERKPYVVEREEIKGQRIILCIFVDQEFLHGKKIEKLAEVSAIIGYSAVYQKDRLSCYIFGEKLERFIPYRKDPEVVEDIIDPIYTISLKDKKIKKVNIDNYLMRHKRSLVVLIGDFFYPVDLIKISGKHKVVVIKIRERDEEDPQSYIGFQLKSYDNKRSLPSLIKPMVKNYSKNVKKLDEELRQQAVLKRIPVKTVYTDEDPFLKLKLLFS